MGQQRQTGAVWGGKSGGLSLNVRLPSPPVPPPNLYGPQHGHRRRVRPVPPCTVLLALVCQLPSVVSHSVITLITLGPAHPTALPACTHPLPHHWRHLQRVPTGRASFLSFFEHPLLYTSAVPVPPPQSLQAAAFPTLCVPSYPLRPLLPLATSCAPCHPPYPLPALTQARRPYPPPGFPPFPSPSCAMRPPPCPIAAICTCVANILATLLPLPPSSTSVTHAPPICTHRTLFLQSHTTTHYTPSPRLLVQSCHFAPLPCSHWQLLAPVPYATSSSRFYHGLARSHRLRFVYPSRHSIASCSFFFFESI